VNRKQFLKISGLTGAGGLLAGCEGLSQLEKMPEGAGVQIVSSVVFLAKYRATPQQQEQARKKGAQIYISQGLKPAAEAKLRAVKSAPAVQDSPPEKKVQAAASIARERQAISASYEALASKAIGGRVPSSLRLDAAPVADVPPDPKISRDLLAAARRQQSIEDNIAVRVAASGNPAERNNPGSVTVMSYNTKTLDLADADAFVLKSSPRAGEQLKLDGVRAVYHD
jgi:hypothetical protein